MKKVKRQLSKIIEKRRQLLADQGELKGNNEKLEKVMSGLRNRVETMHSRMKDLIKTSNALREENTELKS